MGFPRTPFLTVAENLSLYRQPHRRSRRERLSNIGSFFQELPQGVKGFTQFRLSLGGGVGPEDPQSGFIALDGAGADLRFSLADGSDEGVQLLPMLGKLLLAGFVDAIVQRGAGLFQSLGDIGQDFQLGFHPAAEGVFQSCPAALLPDLLGGAVGFQFVSQIEIGRAHV